MKSFIFLLVHGERINVNHQSQVLLRRWNRIIRNHQGQKCFAPNQQAFTFVPHNFLLRILTRIHFCSEWYNNRWRVWPDHANTPRKRVLNRLSDNRSHVRLLTVHVLDSDDQQKVKSLQYLESLLLFFALFHWSLKVPFKSSRLSLFLYAGHCKVSWWAFLWPLFQLTLDNWRLKSWLKRESLVYLPPYLSLWEWCSLSVWE